MADHHFLDHVYAHCAISSHLVRTDAKNKSTAEDGMVLDKMIVDKVLDSYARYCGFAGVVAMHKMLHPATTVETGKDNKGLLRRAWDKAYGPDEKTDGYRAR